MRYHMRDVKGGKLSRSIWRKRWDAIVEKCERFIDSQIGTTLFWAFIVIGLLLVLVVVMA